MTFIFFFFFFFLNLYFHRYDMTSYIGKMLLLLRKN